MATQELKDRILQTSFEMMTTYGIRSVTMDDVARTLGISKKTLYQSFETKDGIVESVVANVLRQHEASCEGDRKRSQNAVHEMMLAMERMTEMMRAMNPSVLFDLKKYHPSAYKYFYQHKHDFLFNIMKRNILRGQEEGLYRENIHAEIMARFRVESVLLPFDPAFARSTDHSLLEMEQELLAHYIFGLVTLKGYKLAFTYFEKRKSGLSKNKTKTQL